VGAIKLEQFGGMLPAWDDSLLPAGQAASSLNGYLFSGSLQGWRQPKKLRDLTNSAAKFVYRVPTVTKSVARAYLVFVANPLTGDTVKVGEVTYEFVSVSPVAKKNEVLIGATATDTAAQLLDVLTATGSNLAPHQSANPSISQVAGDNSVGTANFPASYPYVKVVAPDFGAAYNSTQVAESTSGARLVWVSDFLLTDTTTTFTTGSNSTLDPALPGSATWLEFTDRDTSVVRSPVVDDTFNRHYFASPSTPPQYNTYDRIVAGSAPFLLGIPAPACPLDVSVTGGGDNATLGPATADTLGGTVTIPANRMYALPITPDGAVSLLDVQFLPAVTDTAVNYFAMIFEDNAGVPGTLLNTSVVLTGVTAGTAAVLSFINPSGLLANTPYWIAFVADKDTTITASGPGNFAAYEGNMTFTNGPPATAPAVGSTTDIANLWADLQTSSVQEGRAYVYTWVSEYGEEGPPSPYTLVNGWGNGTWKLGLFQPPPDDQGVQRNIKKINIYRTIPDTSGSTVYYLVTTVPVGTASYTDTAANDVVALNVTMPSTNWFPPPEGLQDIKSMPNGMLVGFKGNEVWFCEPYRPHAWPPGYVLTTEFPIVGIGVTGQTCVAATSGFPYAATGVSPGVATLTKILIPEPCISRGSVLGTDNGVYYMSPNGLILVDNNQQASNTTEQWITRERWVALTPRVNPRAIHFASCYFAMEQGGQTGFTIELKSDVQSFTIWPQPGGHRVGFNQLNGPNGYVVDNIMVDPWTGIAMLIQNGGVYYYDFGDATPAMVPYKWRSKKYQQLTKKSFEAFRVFFTVPPNTPTLSATRNTAATSDASWNTLGANQYLIVRIYGDGNLVTVREVRTSGEILRILSGFKADIWQFEFEGRVVISNLQIGTTVKELASV
jgi:hypothetical protein